MFTPEFFALLEEAFARYQPQNEEDTVMVQELAETQCAVLRRQRAYDDYEYAMCLQKPNFADWSKSERHQLQLLDRYKKQAERELQMVLRQVQAMQRNRLQVSA